MALRFDVGRDQALIKRARAVRHHVFVIEQNIDPAEEWDAFDEDAVHVVAMNELDCRDVATGRMRFMADTAKLQRIAVLKEMRGRNIGFDLVSFMLSHAKERTEISCAKLSSQCYAIPFYERLGFEAYGPVYDDAGIPHRDMKLILL